MSSRMLLAHPRFEARIRECRAENARTLRGPSIGFAHRVPVTLNVAYNPWLRYFGSGIHDKTDRTFRPDRVPESAAGVDTLECMIFELTFEFIEVPPGNTVDTRNNGCVQVPAKVLSCPQCLASECAFSAMMT